MREAVETRQCQRNIHLGGSPGPSDGRSSAILNRRSGLILKRVAAATSQQKERRLGEIANSNQSELDTEIKLAGTQVPMRD